MKKNAETKAESGRKKQKTRGRKQGGRATRARQTEGENKKAEEQKQKKGRTAFAVRPYEKRDYFT